MRIACKPNHLAAAAQSSIEKFVVLENLDRFSLDPSFDTMRRVKNDLALLRERDLYLPNRVPETNVLFTVPCLH